MGSSSSKTPNVTNEGNAPKLEISKQLLDFNVQNGVCPINQAVFDELIIKNSGAKKIKFKFEPVCPTTVQVVFSPGSGKIDRNKSKKIKVKFVMLSKTNVNFKVTLRIDGGPGLFINLKVAGEVGVFGVDPSTLEMVDDDGYKVPSVLVEMKSCILKNNGQTSEGIFRLAGEQTEIKRIKELMNKKSFDYNTKDINTIASLLKIWYRDLPVPILNALPQDQIMNCSEPSDCVLAYQNLSEPQKTLLDWLMDLLIFVSNHAQVNKMTPQNLAIVIAPNLYDISTPNPMEGLILSQKCAQFLNHILNSK